MAWVAAAVIGSGIIGAGANIIGAKTAAKAQVDAADKASNTALSMYDTTRGDLAPYRGIGQVASADLTSRLAELTSPITMDQATLENTPGYKFNLTQGLKATQNSAAARGLGVSGAALKGAAAFATGLADSTYQNQFNNAVTNQSNAFSRLKSLVDTGENASAQTGSSGTAAATTAAGAQIGAGNAIAASDNASGNAIAKAAGNIGGYFAYKGLYGGNGSGSPMNYQDMGTGKYSPVYN